MATGGWNELAIFLTSRESWPKLHTSPLELEHFGLILKVLHHFLRNYTTEVPLYRL